MSLMMAKIKTVTVGGLRCIYTKYRCNVNECKVSTCPRVIRLDALKAGYK